MESTSALSRGLQILSSMVGAWPSSVTVTSSMATTGKNSEGSSRREQIIRIGSEKLTTTVAVRHGRRLIAVHRISGESERDSGGTSATM